MQTALITGGSRGIGAATVRAFVRAGWRVAFFYHQNEEKAAEVARETGALAIRCDISDPEAVRRACAEAERALCHIDALVNNAGIAHIGLFTDLTDEEWQRIIAVDLSGAAYVTRAVLKGMISRKYGRIVMVTSIWGEQGASCEVAYSAAKAGLIGLGKALAKEVAPSGITVNCVAPGVIDTDMMADFDDAAKQALADDIPLGRLGTPEEVAALIQWLCTPQAAYITAQVIGANGGG